jgi:heme/copper-type cytochrome/quinol oxidase subunit 4
LPGEESACGGQMTTLDWIAYGLLAFLFGGILLAFFLYLRTAHKSGGWKRVRRDFIVAIVAILLFALIRIFENQEMDSIKEVVSRWFK